MSASRRIVVVGDALLDRDLDGEVERLCPDAPVPVVDEIEARSRPGGAALAACLAARDGHDVALVTALGGDAGRELAALLAAEGVELIDLGLGGPTPEKVRIRTGGRPLLRLDHGGRVPPAVGTPGAAELRVLDGASAVLVADYGRGVAAVPEIRSALEALPRRSPVVWDPHPRGADPTAGVRLATPNRSEAAAASRAAAGERSLSAVAAQARALRDRWRASGVAVTMGASGALLVEGDGPPFVAPAPPATGGDPCGAGDRFAAAAAALLASGALPSEAVEGAVRSASAFVSAGGAGALRFADPAGEHALRRASTVDLTDGEASTEPAARGEHAGVVGLDAALDLVRHVRRRGGTVVATGGCFDLLHAGHVAVLQAARSLGDCLVVALNDDDSVRRLKGPDRPLQRAEDRAAVLLALGCVDAVVPFAEDTPAGVLERLRPDVFAKGADYSLATLPEAPLLASWGGEAVVLPYLEGRSTTHLVQEAARRARS